MKIEKLQLHHIAKRLPYGLKVKTIDGIFDVCGWSYEIGILLDTTYYGANAIPEAKPILFPLSCLTKEITVNGETFTPIVEIEESLDVPEGASSLLKETISSLSDFYFTKDLTDILRYSDIVNINELLLKWHIDLPHENLIEKGLAISVLDLDKNPYA